MLSVVALEVCGPDIAAVGGLGLAVIDQQLLSHQHQRQDKAETDLRGFFGPVEPLEELHEQLVVDEELFLLVPADYARAP